MKNYFIFKVTGSFYDEKCTRNILAETLEEAVKTFRKDMEYIIRRSNRGRDTRESSTIQKSLKIEIDENILTVENIDEISLVSL